MFITYFIVLLVSIFFKLEHWPGADLLFIITPLFPLIDILVQLVRRKRKPEHTLRTLASVALFGFSFYLVFRLLFWPGSDLLLLVYVAGLIAFVIVFSLKKPAMQKRFIVVFAIALIPFALRFTKTYKIYAFLTVNNPLQPADEHIHEYVLFKLAWFYHTGGENDKAAQTLQQAIGQVERDCSSEEYYYPKKTRAYYCEDKVEILNEQLLAVTHHLPMDYNVIHRLR